MVTMEGLGNAKATRQVVNGFKTVRVSAGCLMRHQNVGSLRNQTKVIRREDGASVLVG